jgi:transitional endoplasmic reticulum ATPase
MVHQVQNCQREYHLVLCTYRHKPSSIEHFFHAGCSKTLMARALATEGKMNFLAVKGPELLSKWLGESERALASLFRRARDAAPSICFFDEIDAIAAERGDINSGGGRLLSQLLTELDGIHSTGGVQVGSNKKTPRVVVVAATNRPDLIDSALMRPGRIDKKIYVGPPDEKSRYRILEIGLRERNCADDIDVSRMRFTFVAIDYDCSLSLNLSDCTDCQRRS